ncbi:MAG: hypothetical protein WA384_14920 [Rhodomicrobium sp.]
MQTIERETESGYFEVILYFEGNSWAFSTFANGSLMQEVLDQAEKEFSVHSMHHELGNIRLKVTAAYLIDDSCSYYLTKHNGKWQLTHASGEYSAFVRPDAVSATGKQLRKADSVAPLIAGV